MSFLSKVGHFLSSAVKNEVSHTENLVKGIVHSPAKSIAQFALGAADPLSSKIWNKAIGTHFTPLVGQLGGETQAQFAQSEKQGVNTGAGRTLTTIANAIAASEAGGYFASSAGLGGLSGTAAKTGASKLIGAGTAALDKSGGNMSAQDTTTGSVLGGATASGGDANSGASGSVDWGSILGSLGSIYSGMKTNGQASSLQTILNNAYGFNNSRPLYTAELNQLMANPEQTVTSSPGYQAKMDQALQATQRTGAAQGLTGSGTEAAALAKTGADLESSTYDQLFQQLSQLSGANLNPSQLFQEQMSQQQTSQNGSGGVFSGLSSLFGGGSSGGSGGGLGSMLSGLFKGSGSSSGSSSSGGLGDWFSGLFSSGSGSGVVDNGSVNLFADAAGG